MCIRDRFGVVIYSGFGLKHYGGVIIIKHRGDLFTAYGFVDKMMIKKGEKVKAKQIIAYLPNKKGAKLYFDVRHRSNRINPLKYLPKQT